jgi:hypothetical protein
MIKKTKFSTITAAVATIAVIAAMGSIGGGLGQQQVALAQVDPRDIGGDEGVLGVVGDIVRDIGEDDENGGEAPVNICGLRLANCEAIDLEAELEAANADFVCQFFEFIDC